MLMDVWYIIVELEIEGNFLEIDQMIEKPKDGVTEVNVFSLLKSSSFSSLLTKTPNFSYLTYLVLTILHVIEKNMF